MIDNSVKRQRRGVHGWMQQRTMRRHAHSSYWRSVYTEVLTTITTLSLSLALFCVVRTSSHLPCIRHRGGRLSRHWRHPPLFFHYWVWNKGKMIDINLSYYFFTLLVFNLIEQYKYMYQALYNLLTLHSINVIWSMSSLGCKQISHFHFLQMQPHDLDI